MHILVVEDEEATRKPLVRLLERGGHLVSGAEHIRRDAMTIHNAIDGALLILGKPVNVAELLAALAVVARAGFEPATSGL